MNKLVQSLGLMVALAATSMLAGCELYFGSHDHNDGSTWNYCGSDGYYQCHGDSCEWVSATCPDPGSTGSGGYECTSSTDCAAGCYCANGTCEEGGFCATDGDCGAGYHCDADRSSCEPNPPGCTGDAECPTGQTCGANGSCTATCTCDSDASAKAQGFGYCDESRGTCMNGTDPAGSCAGVPAQSCTNTAPTCAAGSVPLIDPTSGCFNGQCEAYASCSDAPVCEHINDETDCLSRNDCDPGYTGHDCRKPDGTACHDGDVNCTCATFTFADCTTGGAN